MSSSFASPSTHRTRWTTYKRRYDLLAHAHVLNVRQASSADGIVLQWISEVLHFCQGLPIILVGCKKDLRYDQKTIEELHKTSQKPVTPEQVSRATILQHSGEFTEGFANHGTTTGRRRPQEDRCPKIPRMLSQDERRCARGLRACHPRSSAHPEEGEEEVLDLVDYITIVKHHHIPCRSHTAVFWINESLLHRANEQEAAGSSGE